MRNEVNCRWVLSMANFTHFEGCLLTIFVSSDLTLAFWLRLFCKVSNFTPAAIDTIILSSVTRSLISRHTCGITAGLTANMTRSELATRSLLEWVVPQPMARMSSSRKASLAGQLAVIILEPLEHIQVKDTQFIIAFSVYCTTVEVHKGPGLLC